MRSASPRRPRGALLLALVALAGLTVPWASGCAAIDKPMLALRGVAGGIHNRRKVSGIRAFFLPDGRLGVAANGAVLLEDVPGGTMQLLVRQTGEVDDPHVSPDGRYLVFVAGGEQITAGGGHNDHVYQVYRMELPGELPPDFGGAPVEAGWERVSRSRRAELLPRQRTTTDTIVFVRRTEYEPYSLYESPWGGGALVETALDGSTEVVLTGSLGYPFAGLALTPDDGHAVYGAVAADGRTDLWTVAIEPGAEPELLLESAACPAFLPDGRLAFVRADDAWIGSPGRLDEAAPLGLEHGRIDDLVAAPDGQRLVFTSHVSEPGPHGVNELWEVRLESGAVRRLHVLEGRKTTRTKPLDVVKPFGWWFRSSRMSPGSR